MSLKFEIGGTVILAGETLEFTGIDGDKRVKFIVTEESLKALAGGRTALKQQEKFKLYDRNKARLHGAAERLYQTKPKARIAIRFLDLQPFSPAHRRPRSRAATSGADRRRPDLPT